MMKVKILESGKWAVPGFPALPAVDLVEGEVQEIPNTLATKLIERKKAEVVEEAPEEDEGSKVEKPKTLLARKAKK